jgi:hypothetical protein
MLSIAVLCNDTQNEINTTTPSNTTLCIMTKTLQIISYLCAYLHYFNVILSAIILNVIMLVTITLSVFMLSVNIHSAIILIIIILSAVVQVPCN